MKLLFTMTYMQYDSYVVFNIPAHICFAGKQKGPSDRQHYIPNWYDKAYLELADFNELQNPVETHFVQIIMP
jgi:hypothetical protein